MCFLCGLRVLREKFLMLGSQFWPSPLTCMYVPMI
jgi:hypothetical protein